MEKRVLWKNHCRIFNDIVGAAIRNRTDAGDAGDVDVGASDWTDDAVCRDDGNQTC